MRTDTCRVVVAPGTCACHSVHTIHAHHHDFPEIWAQGGTPAEAAAQLVNQLVRALEAVGSRRRRDSFMQALADVRAFLESLESTASEGPAAACDYPNCPEGTTSSPCRPTS
jgi:hypothetical protein